MNHNPATLSVRLVVCETSRIPAKQSAIPVVEAYLLGCEVGFDRIPAKAFGSGKRLYAVFAKDDRR